MDYLFEVTDNLVWHEYSLAFNYSHRIRKYIDLRRKFNRWSNWFIICVSVVASLSYWSNIQLGAILAGVAAVSLILKELLPLFNQPESELMELHEAATFFSEYQAEMEKLFVQLKYGGLHPVFCQEQFFKLKREAAKFLSITNDYYRGLPKYIDKKIDKQFQDYVSELYPETEHSEL